MNNKFKKFWFKHYVWVILASLLISVFIIIFNIEKPLTSLATLTGIALSTIYFVQKQKLEEIKLFKELFTEFNERYDKLNDKIEDIKSKIITDSGEIHKKLDDYFNLCSEEYLFYNEGRIHNLVWRSWCRGMKEHLSNDIIKGYWEKAQNEDSYYGLTSEIIEKGANLKA